MQGFGNRILHLRFLVKPIAAMRRDQVYNKLFPWEIAGSCVGMSMTAGKTGPLTYEDHSPQIQAHSACLRLRLNQNIREQPPH